jgi:two-component system NtrC family sensor kinase
VTRGVTLAAKGIRARLVRGLGLLGVVVTLLAMGVLLVVGRSSEALRAVEHDARLARDVRALGAGAREQYIHEAHTIVVGDRSHVAHHGDHAERFRRATRALASELPPPERPRLDVIIAHSIALEEAFAHQIVPAVDRGDRGAVREAHERVEALVVEMIALADRLGDFFERRARATAHSAERFIFGALVSGILIALAGFAASLMILRGVWRAVATPLLRMQRVTERVAAGDRDARVGPLDVPELAVVARAFDQMLDRLGTNERELLEAERLAVLGRLAAGVAHELNNPIGVIRGYLKTMRAEATSGELDAELAILDEEARACQRIAEDLLAYARAPSLEVEPVEVAAIVAESIERLRASGELDGREVRAELAARTLQADPVRLRQVLTNLVRNAAQSSEDGGLIDVRGDTFDGGYQLEVLDRGRGIDPGLKGRLFEPFATARAEGTGLGLAVCAEILRAHGGRIRGENRPGGGARFVVELRLPVAEARP